MCSLWMRSTFKPSGGGGTLSGHGGLCHRYYAGKGFFGPLHPSGLPHFTLVGATTRAGLLTAPLRDRFGVVQRLEFYTPQELKTIIMHSAGVLGVKIDPEGALELARRSRGTPRLANRLLKRVRDFAQVKYDGAITKEVTDLLWISWMWTSWDWIRMTEISCL